MTRLRILRIALLAVVCVSALAAAAPFTRLPVGKATVSWRADLPLSVTTPLWLHLHGATDTVEAAFASLNTSGVLVTLTLPGLSKVYADHFADPAAFATLLREVTETVRRASGQTEWTPGELTVSSFSAGFGGVRQLLRQPAAFERIAVLVMADSIYCGYAGPPAERQVDPGLMEGFLRFARLATEGRKRMLITHTQQVPEGYASTTETAHYLLTHTGGERRREEVVWTPGLTQISRCRRGDLEVIGFQGAEAKDHLQHLRSLGLFLDRVRQPGTEKQKLLPD
jgi:hypothetical protein